MPNYINNMITVTAIDCFDSQLEFCNLSEHLLKSAVEIAISKGGVNEVGLQYLTLGFRTTWRPPVEVYKRLESWISRSGSFLEIKAEATWTDEADGHDTRFRWLFDGDRFEVVEVGLLPLDQKLAGPQEAVGEVLSFKEQWQNFARVLGLPEDPFEERYDSEEDLHEDLRQRAQNRWLKGEESKIIDLDQYRKKRKDRQDLPF